MLLKSVVTKDSYTVFSLKSLLIFGAKEAKTSVSLGSIKCTLLMK